MLEVFKPVLNTLTVVPDPAVARSPLRPLQPHSNLWFVWFFSSVLFGDCT